MRKINFIVLALLAVSIYAQAAPSQLMRFHCENDTIKINQLDEQLKTLFRGYIQGKCDEKMYNELKTEIELEKEKLQKDMDRYLEIDTKTDEILANIAEVAANVGKFLKSPIISQKKDILKLILSDCKTDGKNLCFFNN